jgi:hypothetical protein
MDKILAFVLSFQALIWLVSLVIIVVMIIRRIKIKKGEDFEKRDN